MEDLAEKDCILSAPGTARLEGEALEQMANRLGRDWLVQDTQRLCKSFSFPDFATALAFVNQVGEMAEAQDHHPDLHLSWGKVRVEIWTHTIDGLAESDFIFAAKAEKLFGSPAK